jgi:hypothetical protein
MGLVGRAGVAGCGPHRVGRRKGDGSKGKEEVPGIPLQYNLLNFDPKAASMTVNTRRKGTPNGAWSADARWGDKNDPKPWYRFRVWHYQTDG